MKNTRYLLTGLILIGLLIGIVLLIKKNQPTSSTQTTAADMKSKGPKDAPVQMVEYSDFQCPACARAEGAIQKILNDPDFSGKIHFVYRHFPLSGHRWSGLAHQAAECANQQGQFWGYHHALYSQQETWSLLENPTEVFIRYAKELNLPMDAFGLCLANPEIHHRVMQEKKKGDDLKIRSTPTFFINGERLVGQVELEKQGPGMIRKILGLPAQPVLAAEAAANLLISKPGFPLNPAVPVQIPVIPTDDASSPSPAATANPAADSTSSEVNASPTPAS